jgi:hypothetical protein
VKAATTTSAPAEAAPSDSYVNDADFEADVLKYHNAARATYNAPPLVYNASGATFAQNWAGACVFVHSKGPFGENLAAGYASVQASIDGWVDEVTQYSFSSPGFAEATGHFTQVVWVDTTSVGCGRTFCDGKDGTSGWYLVCEYYPAGNVLDGNAGENVDSLFVKNVLPAISGTPQSAAVPTPGNSRRSVPIMAAAAVVSAIFNS